MKTNPYKALRLSKAETQEGIAHITHISKQYISMVERGMYDHVNYKLTLYLIRDSGLTETELERAYNEWRNAKREDTMVNVNPLTITMINHMQTTASPVATREAGSMKSSQPRITPEYRKFKNWRETYWKTPYEFCVDFCLRTYDVTRYEDGRMQGMPVAIQRVLEPFGLLKGFNVDKR